MLHKAGKALMNGSSFTLNVIAMCNHLVCGAYRFLTTVRYQVNNKLDLNHTLV